MDIEQRQSQIILGFKDGVLWNYTHDFSQAEYWLEEGIVETFAVFQADFFFNKEN